MQLTKFLDEQTMKPEKPKYLFKTFSPYNQSDYYRGSYLVSAASALNRWLTENPGVEIIDWKVCAVGTSQELYITIQYKEPEEDDQYSY